MLLLPLSCFGQEPRQAVTGLQVWQLPRVAAWQGFGGLQERTEADRVAPVGELGPGLTAPGRQD